MKSEEKKNAVSEEIKDEASELTFKELKQVTGGSGNSCTCNKCGKTFATGYDRSTHLGIDAFIHATLTVISTMEKKHSYEN